MGHLFIDVHIFFFIFNSSIDIIMASNIVTRETSIGDRISSQITQNAVDQQPNARTETIPR